MNKESITVSEEKIKPKKTKPKKTLKTLCFIFFISILTMGFVLFIFLYQVFGSDLKKAPYFVKLILFSNQESLSSDRDRANFLILGVAGGEHSGPDLTDTMIFFSTDLNDSDTTMVSIPRDIWVSDLITKINAVYHYGEENGKNKGFESLKETFNNLFDQPIDYFFLIDFQAFQEMINLVNGIDVNVERSFDDYQYPVVGKEEDDCDGDKEYKCRYQHLYFDRGLQHMDGKTALMFVRSRNAEGEEGTDFARSQRQQKVMMGLKNKILSFDILKSPQKVKEIYETVLKYLVVYPEMSPEEQVGITKLLLNFVLKQDGFRVLNLETGDDDNPGFLINPDPHKYDQWVLEPINGDWSQIQEFIREKIDGRY